jgi:hypothetical protein
MSAEYKPGDVVKGKVLTATGQWVPVANLYSVDTPGSATAGGSRTTQRGVPSLGRKLAMGFVWVVLAGWLGMGTVFGLATIVLGLAVGGLPQGSQYISDVLGLVLGAWWYVSWLSRKQAHLSR